MSPLLCRIAAIAALICLPSIAPAGPDDGVPVGGGDPECCVHAPSTISRSAGTVKIWVHSFFMEGAQASLYPSMPEYFTLTAHFQYERPDLCWDDEFVYEIPKELTPGETIVWQAEVLDFGWYEYWGSFAETYIE